MPYHQRILILVTAFCLALLPSSLASADQLYGHGNFDGILYDIDIATQSVTTIGTSGKVRFGPDMQIATDGSAIYMPDRVNTANSELFVIDPATGLNTGFLSVIYPGSLNTMVAMEFENGAMIAALAQTGNNGDSTLASVDLGTGAMNVIGILTGVGNLSGLHLLNGTMYGVSTGQGGTPTLYTINTTSAATTSIGPVTFDDGNPATGLTAIAYCNGTMYALVTNNTMLFSLDLTTGELTAEFDMGVAINSLTSFESSSTTAVPVESFTVTAGTLVSGGLTELGTSDNADLSARRSTTDVASRVFVEVVATSPTTMPSTISFTLEASVFARNAVNQSIDFFNYDSGTWEEVDVRAATRFTDSSVAIDATGDLSRFVDSGLGEIRARVRFQSVSRPRQRFSTNVDLMSWTIGN